MKPYCVVVYDVDGTEVIGVLGPYSTREEAEAAIEEEVQITVESWDTEFDDDEEYKEGLEELYEVFQMN
ncbi:MAG: hypothetical protein QXU32_02200 [Nitrososphaerales archaeon]